VGEPLTPHAMGVFNTFFGTLRRSRSGSFAKDGSSRRGRRFYDGSVRSVSPVCSARLLCHPSLPLFGRGLGTGALQAAGGCRPAVPDWVA
jgi:hypothetical protein